MADFTPRTAFGRTEALSVTEGGCLITERVDVALASLTIRRGRADEVAAAATAAGIPLPGPGRHATQSLSAFWLSPDSWMVEAPFASHEDIEPALRAIFGNAASVTEQTDAWVRLDLAGDRLVNLLERLSNFDLAAAADGAATRTVIDHLGCYIIKRAAGLVTLYGPRSSADSLLHALTVAARSL